LTENEDIREDTEDTLKGRYLTFLIDREVFGIEIRYVTEIVGIQAITEMPEMPVYMKGIINLRGRIIPVMDVRLRFGKEARAYDDRTCVIVTEYNRISVGFIVDSVSEVLSIPEEEINARPSLGADGSGSFINMIGKAGSAVILLIDCGKLLADGEEENLFATENYR
jgi:purine-binding chemotaxis protein CheW